MTIRMLTMAVVAIGLALGCGSPSAPQKSAKDIEVEQAFQKLQKVIEREDAAGIWALLTKDARDDAEREARAMKEGFLAMSDTNKPAYEKKSRLSAEELAKMTGQTYLKSAFFFTGEVEELTESKLDRIVVTGDTATVYYVEDNGEKERLPAAREEGLWRFAMPIPKAVLP